MINFRTDEERRASSRDRRAQQRAAGVCINGSVHGGPSRDSRRVHGAVVSGGRCQACIDQRRRGDNARYRRQHA